MKGSVTALITTHAEGNMIKASVDSCISAISLLEARGIDIEVIIAMDRPTKETRNAVAQCASGSETEVIELDYGDQGLVRNHLVNYSTGKYLAFLDGDDLWSENWLLEAFNQAEEHQGEFVIYPEFNWFFEGSNNILTQTDSASPYFDIEAIRGTNLWDALCFCKRSVHLNYPYLKRDLADGFAYEDWNWNRVVFEAGIKQYIAKDTIIFKRRRASSQGSHATKRRVMARPTKSCYFDFYS